MLSESDNLGPLPQIDANAQLQEKSVRALHALLKDDHHFLLRDERQQDYGVDASFEAVVAGCPTNIRSQVQLKAVHSLKPNTEGVRAKSIPTKNLNLLLNGTCPLYLLYIADEDAFYYAWAQDERSRLTQARINWMNQQTVTLYFRDVISSMTLEAIHHRILSEGRLRRTLSDRLASAALNEPISVSIDPVRLRLMGADDAERALITSGLNIVSHGHAKEAFRLADLLPMDRKLSGRVQLVCAYAWLGLGRFQQALGAVGEALAKRAELSKADLDMLLQIRDAAECQTGRITRSEFQRRLQQTVDETTGISRRHDDIESLRFVCLGERNLEKRANILGQLQAAVSAANQDPKVSKPYKLQARIHLAYCTGQQITSAISTALTAFRVRMTPGVSWTTPDARELNRVFGDFERWDAGVRLLIQEAKNLGVPLLEGEALRTRVITCSYLLWSRRYSSRFLHLGSDIPADAIKPVQADAQAAIAIFSQIDHVEGELHAKLNLADLYQLVDDSTNAKILATEVLPRATAFGLSQLVDQAKAHLAGNTILHQLEKDLIARHKRDEDENAASMTDEELDDYARLTLQTCALPPDRLSVVRQDGWGVRHVAQQRLSWCRHIQLIQDLRHTRHPATAYRNPPTQFGHCTKHGFESVLGSTDIAGVIARFKAAFCQTCPDRDPKVKPQA